MANDGIDDLLYGAPEADVKYVNQMGDATTVYADHCMYAARLQSTVRLSFVETLVEPTDGQYPDVTMRHVCQLVLPRAGFDNMLEYLRGVVASWEEIDARAKDGNDAE